MKKFTIYILVFIMLISAVLLYGCAPQNSPADKEALDQKYTEILSLLDTSDSMDTISDYLTSWANENDIPVSHDHAGNIIMSAPATEGYENAESNIFQCTIVLDDKEHTAAEIAVASHIISNSKNHGFIRVLFTPPDGLQKLSRTYINANNFISLDCDNENSILVGSAGTDYYTMTTDLEWAAPSYTDAYQIVITGLPKTKLASSESQLNPITVIGDILATAKSNSILLEIAEFNGGTDRDTYPSSVTCTLLVNQKDANTIKKRISNAVDDFYDHYNTDPETFSFTYSEVEAPEKVISYEDTARLISFLYTCLDGNYLKDDAGEVIAKANISTISTENGRFHAEVCAASKSSDVLQEMETIFETICGLSNISYTKENGSPVWESTLDPESTVYSENDTLDNQTLSERNTLIKSLSAAFDDVTGKSPSLIRTFDYTPCATAFNRSASMNVIAFGISENNISEATEILVKYLELNNIADEQL